MSVASDRDDAVATYRFLRGGLVVLVLALAAGVIVDRVRGACFESSISAYYFTSAHSVFVGVLCAAGALLVIYHGSTDTEDALLSFAGILAIVVALVPTGRPPIVCTPGGLPTDYVTHDATTTNIWALGITLIVAGLARLVVARRKPLQQKGFRLLGRIITVVSTVVLVAGFVVFLVWRDVFDRFAHGASAVGMFLAISATVGFSAFLARRQREDMSPNRGKYSASYLAIFVAMVGTIAVVVVLHFAVSGWNHWVIALEALLLLEFTIYWAVQTVELRNVENRLELLPDHEQETLASRTSEGGVRGAAKHVMAAPAGERLLRAM